MENITKEQFEKIKQKAIDYMWKHKKINSPAFWEIRITPEWFNHIERKNKNHKRSMQESYVRYLCFLHIEYILSNSKLYQEFREYLEKIDIKRAWKFIKENKMANLYWFVAIVNNNKNRVKVVIKKIDWWNRYEFVSVIPVWKQNGYSSEIYFDNEDDFLKSLEFLETKKLSS